MDEWEETLFYSGVKKKSDDEESADEAPTSTYEKFEDFTEEDLQRDIDRVVHGGTSGTNLVEPPEENAPKEIIPESPLSSTDENVFEFDDETIESSSPSDSVLTVSDLNESHSLNFHIGGSGIQYLAVSLDPDQEIFAEPGALRSYSPLLTMTSKLFGGSGTKGFGKFLSPLKRAISGESFFLVHFSNSTTSCHQLIFSAPYPGEILPIVLDDIPGIHCQSGAFLRIPEPSGHRFRCKLGHPFRTKLDQAFRCKVGH